MKAVDKLACLFLGALSGCSDSDFPAYYKLAGLRVLAIKADRPELSPGETVSLSPFVSFVDQGTRTLVHSASLCTDPGGGERADPGCEGAADRVDLLPESALDLSSSTARTKELSSAFSVAIPANSLDGLSDAAKLIGRYYLVSYRVRASDGTQVKAVRRIRVSTNPLKETNPAISGLQAAGAAIATFPTVGVVLRPEYSAVSANFPDGTRRELTTTWFMADGKIEKTRTVDDDTNTLEKEASDPSIPKLIVLVTRDDRGGVDVRKFEF